MHARLALPLRLLALETAAPSDLPWLATPVARYFDGDLRALDAIPVDQPGPPSRQRLWAALRAVPPGRTVSYTELAAQAGNPRAPRAAGAACAYNLIAPVVPCHRALRSDGSLGGYYYGLDRKTWLLRHEGARSGKPGAPGGTGPAANPEPTRHEGTGPAPGGLRCGRLNGWDARRSGRRRTGPPPA